MAAPTEATNEAVLMIEPPPARRMAGIWWRQPYSTPFRFTARVLSMVSSLVAMASASSASMIPALLKAMSNRP